MTLTPNPSMNWKRSRGFKVMRAVEPDCWARIEELIRSATNTRSPQRFFERIKDAFMTSELAEPALRSSLAPGGTEGARRRMGPSSNACREPLHARQPPGGGVL